MALSPEAAIARVAAHVNQPRRRAFGLLKTQREFVGVVGAEGFEIWERGQRAVHAIGLVRAIRGGTRVELRFRIPRPTRMLIALFFVLYAVVAIGMAQQPPETLVSSQELVASVVGAVVLATIFAVSARQQRIEAQSLLEKVFSDLPAASGAAYPLLPVEEAGQTEREIRKDVQDDHRQDL